MRCVKCGQELPDDANFCRRCGSPTIRNMSYLVQKARENDQEALTEIYKISSPAVYKTIRVLIKDEDTVYGYPAGYICEGIYQVESASESG